MELTNIQNTQVGTLGAGDQPAVQQQATGQTPAAPVLAGAAVTVKGSTDFEKLLAELELKRDEQQQKILQGQFSAALAVLAGHYSGITSAQQESLKVVEEKSAALEQAAAAVQTAASDLDAATVLLQVETEKLEAMVEAQRKTPEERLEEIETAERKEEDVQAAEAAEEQVVEETAGEEVVEEESEEIKAQRAKIEELQADVATKTAALASAQQVQSAAEAALKTALQGLDQTALLVVDDAVRLAGKIVAAAAAEQPEGKEVEEKTNAIVEALGAYADKLEELRDDELAEKIAKITTDVAFLATARTQMKPGDLPEYTQTV